MNLPTQTKLLPARLPVNRRQFAQRVTAASYMSGAFSFSGLLKAHAEAAKKAGRAMILLWMNGGPSQFETFDPKSGEAGGGTKSIATKIPGVQIAEYWEQTAQVLDRCAVIRSLTNKEGNHQRAVYQLHTGYTPTGSVKHPSFASNVAHEIGPRDFDLPSFVSIGRTQGAGFLGVDYEPFVVDAPGQPPRNLENTVSEARLHRRLGLLNQIENEYAARGGKTVVENQQPLYGKTSRLVLSPRTQAFDLDSEPAALKEKYGKSNFGRGCLLARRLVEAGVTFVEVRSDGWDTHQDVGDTISGIAKQVDPAMAALITDLEDRKMLDTTTVVWLGEFGRTPTISPRGGRDHFPRAFSCVLAGGGIRGGQVIGKTSADGSSIEQRPVTVPDLFVSLSKTLAIDPRHENHSPLGRPLKIVDGGEVVQELFS